VRKKSLVLWLVVFCALALIMSMTAAAYAEDETETEIDPDAWQVRTIATPVPGTAPSFVSAANGILAWTGAEPGGYSGMYVFDLVSGVNTAIPMALPGNYYNPSADGPWVVFQGRRAGGASDDVYLYDTGNGVLQQITHNSDPGDNNDWNPRLDDGRIVWEKDMTGPAARPGIYLYDVDTATTTCLLEGDGYRDPDLSGDYVVCTRPAETGGGSEIILYNLVTKETRTIADGTKSNEDPRMDGGKVVWSAGDIWSASAPDVWFTYQIMLYDVATAATTALTNNAPGNTKPSVKEGIVAWKTEEPSAIMVHNTLTGFTGQLSGQGDTVQAPEVDEGGIAWCGTKGLYYAVPAAEAPRFPDVPADHPYATAIESMADLGIIEGYDSGDFGLQDPVTRQQFAKMIVLTMAVDNPAQFTPTLNDTYEFEDADSIETVEGQLYAYHYVAKAALTGLTKGYPDGTFRPLANITRQQVITMIVRAGSRVLAPPPSSWQGVLGYSNPEHGPRIRLAEYNGLLSGITGPRGTLANWDTTEKATRGEVAQMLYNLLGRLGKLSTAD